jgi:hypothetical protein
MDLTFHCRGTEDATEAAMRIIADSRERGQDTPPTETERQSAALFGAVGPCADPVQRVHHLYMVNTTAGNVKGQLGILAAMSRDNGVPAWYCERLQKLADALLTVGGLEAPNDQALPQPPDGNGGAERKA